MHLLNNSIRLNLRHRGKNDEGLLQAARKKYSRLTSCCFPDMETTSSDMNTELPSNA